jgi:hypothetical protein
VPIGAAAMSVSVAIITVNDLFAAAMRPACCATVSGGEPAHDRTLTALVPQWGP